MIVSRKGLFALFEMCIDVVSPVLIQPLVKFKSHFYYEEKDLVSETEKKLAPLSGSQVRLSGGLGREIMHYYMAKVLA